MARPREFDEQAALDEALLAFWKKGYSACTVSDLVSATGLKRQSLYNTFGDKRELFLKALARYRQRVNADLLALHHPSAGCAELREYLQHALASQQRYGSGACLLVSTSFSPEMADPDIAKAVRAGAKAVRNAFATLLQRQIDAGVLRCDLNVSAAAAGLYTTLNGLSALSRTGGSKTQQKAILDQTLASLHNQPTRR